MNELTEHPTVEYIKALENDRQHYKESLSVQTKKFNDLRIAFTAVKLKADGVYTNNGGQSR